MTTTTMMIKHKKSKLNSLEQKFVNHKIHWHKEVFLLALAVISLILLGYEELRKPSDYTLLWIDWFDFVVACIFLIDFFVLYNKAKSKKEFMTRNWYLLVASIPLYTSWAMALRGIRILRFIRLVSTGEHLDYSYLQTRHK